MPLLSEYNIDASHGGCQSKRVEREEWLDLKTFVDCFEKADSWRVLCDQCLGNYSQSAKHYVKFRFIDQPAVQTSTEDIEESLDVSCIYTLNISAKLNTNDDVSSHHVKDRFATYNLEEGVDLVYVGPDISTRISLYEIVKLRPGQSIAFCPSPGVGMAVLMQVPSSLRLQQGPIGENASSFGSLKLLMGNGEVSADWSVCDAKRKERQCDECGIIWHKRMPKCSRCQTTRYCSALCQRRAWKEHKVTCRRRTSKRGLSDGENRYGSRTEKCENVDT